MLPAIPTKQLPLVLQALLRDAQSGSAARKAPKQRTWTVLAMPRGMALERGSIEQTLGGMPVEQVPFHEGGGDRTRSPVFLGFWFSGRWFFGVAPIEGRHSFNSVEEIAVACDHWLAVVEGEQAADRDEREIGDRLRRGMREEEAREAARVQRVEREGMGPPVVEGDFVITDATGDMGYITPTDRLDRGEVFAMIERGPNAGSRLAVGQGGRLHPDWVRLGPGLSGLSGSLEPTTIRLSTVEKNGKLEHVGDFTLEEMISANADDEALVAKLNQLHSKGDSFDWGGGAAPRMRMTFV